MSRSLKPSIITSFSSTGFLSPDGGMPNHVLSSLSDHQGDTAVEAYLFMQGDVEFLCRHLQSRELPNFPSSPDAVGFLASVGRLEIPVDCVAGLISECIRAARAKISALATFIPEIASLAKTTSTQAAQAIAGALMIGRELQTLGHPAHAVELVAGSSISDVSEMSRADAAAMNRQWRAQKKANPALAASRTPLEDEVKGDAPTCLIAAISTDDEKHDAIIETLKSAISIATQHCGNNLPLLAMELEPGPLFNLRNEQTLESLNSRLNAHPELSQRVGFNLDIAHWNLARITPQWLDENDCHMRRAGIAGHFSVIQRVVHAHIAGYHRKGHIGDTALLAARVPSVNDDNDFAKWITILKARLPDDGLRFSGCISLEYEAAQSPDEVSSSFRELTGLISRT